MNITVTLVDVATIKDDYGNSTETETRTTWDQVRFAPRSSNERADNRSPGVITGASLYRRGPFPVASTSRIEIADADPRIDGVWEVQGDPGPWGPGVEAAITRAH